MFSPAFTRILWKEYRVQRSLWLAVFLFGALMDFVFFCFATRESGPGYFFIALHFPLLFAIGSGAMSFANEREQSVDDWMRIWSARWSQLWFAKTLFCLTSTFCLSLVLFALAVLFAGGIQWGQDNEFGMTLPTSVVLAVAIVTWTMFASLLVSTSLQAVLLAAGAGMVFYLIGSWLFLGEAVAFFAGPWTANRQFPVAFHAAAISLMTLANVVLSRYWVTNRPWRWPRLAILWPEISKPQARTLTDRRRQRSALARSASRLLWLQVQKAVLPTLLFAFVGGLSATVMLVNAPPRELFLPDSVLAPAILLALGAGVAAFQADKRDGRYRFLGEHGIGPTMYWLTSQIVWLSVAVLQLLVLLAVGYAVVRYNAFYLLGQNGPGSVNASLDSQASSELLAFRRVFPVAFLGAFGISQFFSMFLRSGIASFFLSIMLGWFLCLCVIGLQFLQAPVQWFLGPIVVGMYMATWIHSRDWLEDRWNWKKGLRAFAFVAVPFVAAVIALPFYRVYSIPKVTPDLPTLPSASAGDKMTEAMFANAMEAVVEPPIQEKRDGEEPVEYDLSSESEWAPLSAAQRSWLEANESAIDLAIQAAERPLTPFHSGGRGLVSIQGSRDLWRLLVLSARSFEEKGDLDSALERYRILFQMTAHLADDEEVYSFQGAALHRSLTLRLLVRWANRPEQTSERIKEAIAIVEQSEQLFPTGIPLLAARYEWVRRNAEAYWSGNYRLLSDGFMSGIPPVDPELTPWVPWEKWRSLRLVSIAFQRAAEQTRVVEAMLARSTATAFSSPPEDVEFHKWLENSIRLPSWTHSAEALPFEMIRYAMQLRATKIQLALLAWRAEHGEFPDKLDVLVGPYFESMPIDPYRGEPFGFLKEGLPNEIRFGESAPNPVQIGQPFVWSAGRERARLILQAQAGGKEWRYVLVDQEGIATEGIGVAFPLPREMGK